MNLFLRISICLTGLILLGSSILICYLGMIERAEDTDRIIDDYQESAVRWRNMGNYDEALQILNKTLSEYPYDRSTYLYRAQIYYLKGDYDTAISDCNKAIQLNDKYVYVAYFIRGSMYLEKKEFNKALSDLNEALRLSPGEAMLFPNDIKLADIHKRIEEVKQQERQGGQK